MKKDTFFICLFTLSFLVCATVITKEYLCRQIERKPYNSYSESDVEEKVDTDDFNEQLHDEGVHDVGAATGNESTDAHETDKSTIPESDKIEIAEKPVGFESTGYDYFDDALFIGDSRTVGIMEYGNIESATFFADSGMSVFQLEKKMVSVPNLGKVSFEDVLENKKYGKIYLMLGINELGYRFENIAEKYQETVEKIRTYQSDAVIYLCANLHVTKEQSENDSIYNNDNVNRVNQMISKLADNENIFYIDINEVFDDESGSLGEEYSGDSFHVYGKYYRAWVDWLCTKAIAQLT